MTDFSARLQGVLGSSYELERELGGGMSRVFVARETALGRRVVVKVLPPEMAGGVNAERFRREIQLAASLQHPHIVPLLTAGSSGDLLYYVMPMVEGDSLRDRIVRGGELPIATVVRVLRDVSAALSYAHARGVAHRDIKPDNILLAGDFALVTDFGVAKAVSEATGETSITSIGIALGTPTYMAPEQAAADPHADYRVDIYALGAVAYEMLTGRPPFTAPSPQMVLAAHVSQTPEPVTAHRASVPAALATIVMRCLEKKPADRWQSADEVYQQLASMATPSAGYPPTEAVAATARVQSHGAPAWRSRRTTVAAAFVLGAAALAATAFLFSRGSTAEFDPQRVSVQALDNRTGDPALAPVGRMAADWITQGISQAGVAEVMTGTASSGGAAAGRDIARDLDAAAAAGGRAGTLIRGSYYKDGDSLRFQVEIADARNGRVIRSLEPVAALAGAPMPAIDRLRQRVVGALATLNSEDLADWARATTEPPTFAAYQEYLAGVEALGPRTAEGFGSAARVHFLRAFELDSTFVYAALAAAEVAEPHIADSLLQRLERMRPRLSPVDRASIDRVQATARGDWDGVMRAARQIAALTPGRRAYFGVASAAYSAGRPHEALAALERADPEWKLAAVEAWGDRTDALHLLGDYKRELAAVRRRAELGVPDVYDEVQIHATLGNVSEVERRIDERIRRPARENDTPAAMMWFAAREYTAHGHIEEGKRMAERAVSWVETLPPDEVTESDRVTQARSLYHARRWAEARSAFERLLEGGSRGAGDTLTQPGSGVYSMPFARGNAELLGGIGAAAAQLRDTASANHVFAVLASLPRQHRAEASYQRAKIAAVLGRPDQAAALVQQAWAAGLPYGMWFHRDIEFHPYSDRSPFKELLNPQN